MEENSEERTPGSDTERETLPGARGTPGSRDEGRERSAQSLRVAHTAPTMQRETHFTRLGVLRKRSSPAPKTPDYKP